MPHSPHPPRFGDVLRRLREARRVSRETLAFASGVSASYLTHLERGNRERPTLPVVRALLNTLDRARSLTDAERRHLLDLAGVGIDAVPSVEQLRTAVTAGMRRNLRLAEPRLASYFDTRLNLLACNQAYTAAFTGLREGDNVLRWILGNPLARQIMSDWEDTVRRTVGWLHGAAGTLGRDQGFGELLAELTAFPEFREAWNTADPIYSDQPNPLRLRNTDTGAEIQIDVQEFRMDSARYPGWIWYFQSTPPRRISSSA